MGFRAAIYWNKHRNIKDQSCKRCRKLKIHKDKSSFSFCVKESTVSNTALYSLCLCEFRDEFNLVYFNLHLTQSFLNTYISHIFYFLWRRSCSEEYYSTDFQHSFSVKQIFTSPTQSQFNIFPDSLVWSRYAKWKHHTHTDTQTHGQVHNWCAQLVQLEQKNVMVN